VRSKGNFIRELIRGLNTLSSGQGVIKRRFEGHKKRGKHQLKGTPGGENFLGKRGIILTSFWGVELKKGLF